MLSLLPNDFNIVPSVKWTLTLTDLHLGQTKNFSDTFPLHYIED